MLQSANDVVDFLAKALGVLLSSCHVCLVLLFFGLLGVDCFFFLSLFFFWFYCSFSAFASYAGCFYKYLQLPSKRKWKLNKQYFIYLFSYLLCCAAALMATGTNYREYKHHYTG